jgi:hypothetical protein
MSKILVDTIDTRSGTSTLTLGSSNLTTLTKASGVNANFAGVKVADQWRTTANISLSADTSKLIDSDWSQVNSDGFANIGSSMSQSSGIWTFPETGIYLIQWLPQIKSPSQGATFAGGGIYTTTDNSSYDIASDNYNSIYHANGRASVTTSFIFDVTNTTTHKVKLYALCEFASTLHGGSSLNRTYVTFTRLGDT